MTLKIQDPKNRRKIANVDAPILSQWNSCVVTYFHLDQLWTCFPLNTLERVP
jgi:hypothetical protein